MTAAALMIHRFIDKHLLLFLLPNILFYKQQNQTITNSILSPST